MKRLMRFLTIITSVLLLATGCSGDKISKYAKVTIIDNKEDLSFSSVEKENGLNLYVDNESDTKYYGVKANLLNENGDVVEEYEFKMIRPNGYEIRIIDSSCTKYEVTEIKVYDFKDVLPFKYGCMTYDNNTFDAYKTGGFNEEEIEKVAKQEYVASYIGGSNLVEGYYYDANETYTWADEEIDEALNEKTVQYYSFFDFENKKIEIYEYNNEELIKEIKMDI